MSSTLNCNLDTFIPKKHLKTTLESFSSDNVDLIRKEVITKLSNLLIDEDDLKDVLSELKKYYMNEKNLIESQVTAGIQNRVLDTSFLTNCIKSSREFLMDVKEHFKLINDLCLESHQLIDHFSSVKQISIIHQNIMAAKSAYEKFSELNFKLERVTQLISAEMNSDARGQYILLIHYYLFKLEELKGQTLSQVTTFASLEITELIQKYFKRYDLLKEKFEEYFWSILCQNLFIHFESRNKDLIIKIIHIIEKEETEDLKLTRKFHNIEKRKGSKTAEAMNRETMNREVRNYKQQFLCILHKVVSERFQDKISKEANNAFSLFEELKFYLNDLLLIQTELEACFPERYHIVEFFIMDYHKNIYEILHQRIFSKTDKLSAIEILKLLEWVQHYFTNMRENFGMVKEMLEPCILDEEAESALIAHYLKLSKSKLSIWLNNLFQTEQKSFLLRETQPEEDSNGKYVSLSANDLFQIVKQIIEPTAQAIKGKLLSDVVRETVKLVIEFLQRIYTMVDIESDKPLDMLRPGLEEYTIMIGNTVLKWAEYLDELSLFIECMIDPNYKNETLEWLSSCNHSLLSLIQICIATVASNIVDTVKPTTATLFTSAWYKNSPLLMSKFIATFDDYFQDFQVRTVQFIFNKLVGEVLERVIIVYIQQMKSKTVLKFKPNLCQSIFLSDIGALQKFFNHYWDPERVHMAFAPLDKLLVLFNSSKTMMFLDFFTLWKSFPDMNIDFIEDLLGKREDLSKSFIKELIGTIKMKIKEERFTTFNFGIDVKPSVFSKIK